MEDIIYRLLKAKYLWLETFLVFSLLSIQCYCFELINGVMIYKNIIVLMRIAAPASSLSSILSLGFPL